jgi:hypothetical protein
MSRTNIDAGTKAALQAAHVTMFVLLELGFDSGTVYLADLPFDITISGQVYTGAQGIGTIDVVTETDKEAKGLSFTLSGVPSAQVANVLNTNLQGRSCVMKLAVWDGATLNIDPGVWSGVFDVQTLLDDVPTSTVRVTAEHLLIAWQQPRGNLSSNEDQQLLSPGDKFFEFAADVSTTTLVWPNKSFFQK